MSNTLPRESVWERERIEVEWKSAHISVICVLFYLFYGMSKSKTTNYIKTRIQISHTRKSPDFLNWIVGNPGCCPYISFCFHRKYAYIGTQWTEKRAEFFLLPRAGLNSDLVSTSRFCSSDSNIFPAGRARFFSLHILRAHIIYLLKYYYCTQWRAQGRGRLYPPIVFFADL